MKSSATSAPARVEGLNERQPFASRPAGRHTYDVQDPPAIGNGSSQAASREVSEATTNGHATYRVSKDRSVRAPPSYHPYKPSPSPLPAPSAPQRSASRSTSPTGPIHFVDATFAPGNSSVSSYSGAVIPHCRPKRKKVSDDQLSILLDTFETTDNPCFDVREAVGNQIGMSNREVQVWFQNRRAKVTRERAAALAKENASRPPLLSTESLPAPARATADTGSISVESTRNAGQHQWRFADAQASQRKTGQVMNGDRSTQGIVTGLTNQSVPHYRRMFGEQRILLPESTSRLSSIEPSSTASDSTATSGSNPLTPPLCYSPTTPGGDSPRCLEGHSPIHFPSPASAFGRLGLYSPPIYSTTREREPIFFANEPPSPDPSEPEELIRLAPLRGWTPGSKSKRTASNQSCRRRSMSNPEPAQILLSARNPSNPFATAKRPVQRPPHVRLPSIHNLLNPVEQASASPGAASPELRYPSGQQSMVSSYPNSPKEQSSHGTPAPLFSKPASPRPGLVSRHTSDAPPLSESPQVRRYGQDKAGPALAGLGVLTLAGESLQQRSYVYYHHHG